MIVNSKAWDISLQFDALKLESKDHEGKVYIPGRSIKGGILSFIENIGINKEYIKSTFGYFDGENGFSGDVLISDFEKPMGSDTIDI